MELSPCPSGSIQIPKLTLLARTIKHRLTHLIFGRKKIEPAYWNGYNDAIWEAIHIATGVPKIISIRI